jgi:hypothetical protein
MFALYMRCVGEDDIQLAITQDRETAEKIGDSIAAKYPSGRYGHHDGYRVATRDDDYIPNYLVICEIETDSFESFWKRNASDFRGE